MGGKASRTKGHAFERDVAKRLREVYRDARRGLSQCRSGNEVADVQSAGEWWVETKAHAKVGTDAAMKQALEAMVGTNLRPLVVSKSNYMPVLATILMDDFMRIIGELEMFREQAKISVVKEEVAIKAKA